MPRRLFDFKCDLGHTTEHLVETDVTVLFCPECKSQARRLIPAPRPKLEGITGAFPTAYDAWTRMHEEGARQARERRLKDEGPDAS